MKKTTILWLLFSLMGIIALPASAQCTAENNAFSAGEDLSYKLYFNWKFIWVTVGTANMSIKNTSYQGQEAYRCHLITKGNKMADKLFVLRDTLVSIVNDELVPFYYRKGALEGDRYTVDEAWYSYPDGKNHIKQRFKTHKDEIRLNDQKSNVCVYDMLSMMLRARSFDASDYKVGQKIKFPMADGGKVEEQTLIYRGKKNFKMEESKIPLPRILIRGVRRRQGKGSGHVLHHRRQKPLARTPGHVLTFRKRQSFPHGSQRST